MTLREGRVRELNHHHYRILHLREMLVLELPIVPSTEKMGATGELGTRPIASVVANAVFALTGQRLRELPLRLPAAPTAGNAPAGWGNHRCASRRSASSRCCSRPAVRASDPNKG